MFETETIQLQMWSSPRRELDHQKVVFKPRLGSNTTLTMSTFPLQSQACSLCGVDSTSVAHCPGFPLSLDSFHEHIAVVESQRSSLGTSGSHFWCFEDDVVLLTSMIFSTETVHSWVWTSKKRDSNTYKPKTYVSLKYFFLPDWDLREIRELTLLFGIFPE